MANNENLMQNRSSTPKERRDNASRAGKASGEARRRKTNLRKTLNDLLTSEVDLPEWTPMLNALGLESTLETVMSAAMVKEAIGGNVKAYMAIKDVLGQTSKSDEDLEEQKIRTDRAKRARDMETGESDGAEENIHSFLKAMNPEQEDIDNLFAEYGEEEADAESTEETDSI